MKIVHSSLTRHDSNKIELLLSVLGSTSTKASGSPAEWHGLPTL
jgi:hypothetical protein